MMKQNLRQCLANGIVLAAVEYGKSRDQTRAKLDQRYKDLLELFNEPPVGVSISSVQEK